MEVENLWIVGHSFSNKYSELQSNCEKVYWLTGNCKYWNICPDHMGNWTVMINQHGSFNREDDYQLRPTWKIIKKVKQQRMLQTMFPQILCHIEVWLQLLHIRDFIPLRTNPHLPSHPHRNLPTTMVMVISTLLDPQHGKLRNNMSGEYLAGWSLGNIRC